MWTPKVFVKPWVEQDGGINFLRIKGQQIEGGFGEPGCKPMVVFGEGTKSVFKVQAVDMKFAQAKLLERVSFQKSCFVDVDTNLIPVVTAT